MTRSHGIINVSRILSWPLIRQFKFVIARLVPWRVSRLTKADWETEYADGKWDYLRGIKDLARYSIIVGYTRYYGEDAAILDVGCGEGVLQKRLKPGGYARYVGIDLSEEAIHRASSRCDEKTLFVTGDVCGYETDERFDVIVFNECLCYFDDPLRLVRKYERVLNAGGVIVASLFVTGPSARVWRRLESFYTVEDAVRVSKRAGPSWDVKVYRPTEIEESSAGGGGMS